MTKAADEIKAILYNCKENYGWLNESWLAGKLGMSPQALNFQLNKAKKFDQDLYDNIKLIFTQKGILNGTPDECVKLNTLTLELGASMGKSLGEFYSEVKKNISDGVLTEKERPRLKVKLADLKENFLSPIEELEKLLG